MSQTLNMHHSSNFDAFLPVKNPQNVKLLPEIVIFQELLIAETWNLQHWNQRVLNPKYMPLKPFQCIFPSQNNKMWNFGCFLNSPWQKTEKLQFAQRKSVCKSAHIGFLGMPIAMHYVRTLCDKYFLSYYGLSAFFMWRSRYWVMKRGVGVNGTQGRLLHMSHPVFMVLNPMFCDVSPKIVIFHELLIVETRNKCH